jgi:hypothetical protein
MIPNLFRNGGSLDFRSSLAREAASRLKREQARKQRAKMTRHNKRQRAMNKQHGRHK